VKPVAKPAPAGAPVKKFGANPFGNQVEEPVKAQAAPVTVTSTAPKKIGANPFGQVEPEPVKPVVKAAPVAKAAPAGKTVTFGNPAPAVKKD